MFVFIQTYKCNNPEKFAFLFLTILGLYISKAYDMFIYKHPETIEYVKN